jgi:hypothetical protein
MDIWFFLPILFLLTMLAGIVFALVSKRKVDQRRNDPNALKSTLASDAPSHGKPTDT